MMLNAVVIGEKLRTLRGDKTLEKISQETGIGRSALNMYEIGQRIPRDDAKIRLAEYYGVSIEELFYAHEIT